MARFLHSFHPFTFRKYARYFLAFSWLSGLAAGILLFHYRGDALISMLEFAPASPVSVVGLLTAAVLPLLFSGFAVYVSCPELLLPLAFLEACSYTYLARGVYVTFGDAGWLIHILLLFTDTGSLLVLYFYWLRHISGFRGFRFRNAAGYAAGLCLIAAADLHIVAPFLRNLPL